MCSKQFWVHHEYFLATQHMIIMMTTITLLQLMGIISTKGTCRKCNNSLGGKVQVKYKHPYILDWNSHCVSKTYIRQNTVLKKTKPKFRKGCQAYEQFQRKENHLQTPIRCESLDFSCHSTEPTEKAWKPQFRPRISLSLVWLPHSTFVKSGQPVPKGLPLCNF